MVDASSDVVLNDVQPSSSNSKSPNVPVEELNGLPPSSPPPTTASSVGSGGAVAATTNTSTTTAAQIAATGTGNTVTAPTAVASSISTSTTTVVKPSSSKTSAKPKSTKPKPRPSINAAAATSTHTGVNATTSTPSPSPPPPTLPPPPPPRQTIRLQIKLGGPERYEVDIAALAKETGQRPPTPVPVKRDTSESEGESDGDNNNVNGNGKGEGGGKGDGKETRKRKKRSQASEYYDVNDPFIDDSELAIDERTYFAQTKQQGFYVSSGEVALLKDKSSPKKPKPKKHQPEASSSSSSHTHLAPSSSITGKSKDLLLTAGSMPLSDIDEGDASSRALPPYGSLGLLGHVLAKDRKRYTTVVENGKKKKVVDVASFHPELREAIGALKGAIEQESWEQKGKFPPNIKPLLNSVAIQAIKLDEYDDHFFNLMPTLFPYNKFTMTKLIKRTVFPDHCQILTDRQDELLEELTALANAGFTKAEEEYEKHLSQWAQRQEQHRVEAELNGRSESTGAGGEDPSRHGTEDEGGGGPGGGGSGGGGSAKDAMDVDRAPPSHSEDTPTAPSTATTTAHPKENPPTKRYRLTDAMKLVIWQLVSISNELCRLENEKNQYENSMATKSDQALRKSLYQKIVAAFPPGWMSSGQISREVSVMKKRLERETAENES